MLWLEVLCTVFFAIIIGLSIKLYLLYKSMNEVTKQMQERLEQDTNTLLTISSRDQRMRKLVTALNKQLKQLREERRKYQSGNLELKNAVTNISHDLRTPLTAIRGYLDLLKKESLSTDTRRYLDIIANRTNALEQLTEELFRYSVITNQEHLVYEEVSLNSALEESILAYYAALIENGITPQITMPEYKVIRKLDKQALARLFSNIMSNIIKYSSGDLEIILLDNGTICFSNSAPDLDGVEVERLFDRFYTVETARNSTGLGLSIAKSLVEKMNGNIKAEYLNGKLQIKIYFL